MYEYLFLRVDAKNKQTFKRKLKARTGLNATLYQYILLLSAPNVWGLKSIPHYATISQKAVKS